jgi:archaeosortase A (PGF-CTERM-specific)
MVVTRAAAIASIFYFPFVTITTLGNWVIDITASLSLAFVNALGYPAVLKGQDILLNGQDIQLIFACTAFQSMALFIGVIGCIKAPAIRLFEALLVSVPAIFILNLIRITFVVIAGGDRWFQFLPNIWGVAASSNSSFWAHNFFAEAGSLIALVVISYAVFRLLPETIVYLRDIFSLMDPKNIMKNIRGEQTLKAKPVQGKA